MPTDTTDSSADRAQSNLSSYHHRNRPVVIPDGAMAIGLIVGAHGLRGELKVEIHTDFAERFDQGNTILLGVDLREVEIEASRPHKAFQLMHLGGVSNRSDAKNLRGQWLFIRDDEATPLEDDTYWIHEIVGMDVEDTKGRRLGHVHNILQTGANDVYLVEPAEGINQGREILLPAIVDVVQQVDTDKRLIVVKLIPGLLDELDDEEASS